jgi:hypothetical protein
MPPYRPPSVESYTAKDDATLTLEHDGAAVPRGETRGPRVRALVDVSLLLESLKAEQTRPGQWVNVIGYIAAGPNRPSPPSHHQRQHQPVHVQALLLWSAGPLNVHEYAPALSARSSDDHGTTDGFGTSGFR